MTKISNSTIRRLSIYLRQLENLIDENVDTVLSAQLAELSNVKDTQLRKDLSFFGSFGVRGRGYAVSHLTSAIKKILGLDQEWSAVIFGAGSLGHALAGYRGFEKHNIRIAAIIDVDPGKVGRKIGPLPVEPLSRISKVKERTGARIAVIAVPAAQAGDVADTIVKAGFEGIVNFAPVRLVLPKEIALYSVDLAIAFEHITYMLRGSGSRNASS